MSPNWRLTLTVVALAGIAILGIVAIEGCDETITDKTVSEDLRLLTSSYPTPEENLIKEMAWWHERLEKSNMDFNDPAIEAGFGMVILHLCKIELHLVKTNKYLGAIRESTHHMRAIQEKQRR